MNTEILTVALGLTFFFILLTVLFFWQSHRLKDIRTLRLGRLTALWLASAFFAINGIAMTIIFIFLGNERLGGLILALEVALISLITFLLSIAIPIAIIVLSIRMWRRESKNLANFILPILMLLFMIVDISYISVQHLSQNFLWLQILAWTYPILAVYMGWQFLVFFLSSWVYGRRMRKTRAQYFVVHGAGLINGQTVGRLLANRIKAAVNVAGDSTMIIMSGGKGSDENLSEAEAMRSYAIDELGFPSERILLEDQSTTTYENLVYSSQLIEAKEEAKEARRFMFFSSDYHVFRAALFAARLGLDAQGGPGGKTAIYYRVPAFIREFIAVLNYYRKKHLIIIGLIVGFLLLFSIIVFIMQHKTVK
ncbi:YdcF family protein [Lactococcus termiticola]|uniref:DUF218 domain-containing protein n=1 Tax=Lactococcus termiticola TaxID=2169526 RepID=A0A2R5HCW5_9LACT|nr:YdcF family protein [Lactococcus termiticola]GBG95924.1 hypothetical protein NtB2_00026 [Lactococcus termiticola]